MRRERISNPANPVYLRDWALDGQQPGGTIPPHLTAVPSIHGPISTGPEDGVFALAGATANRVYFAYGTSSNGVMQNATVPNFCPHHGAQALSAAPYYPLSHRLPAQILQRRSSGASS